MATNPAATHTPWSGQWVADRLGVALHGEGPGGPGGLHDLLGLALRRNPKRAHLLVSHVLGKHVPQRPDVVYGSGRDLGLRVRELLGPRDAARAVVLGYAETATGLGHAVADGLGAAPYLHSTRREVPGVAPGGGFEEEHSHATGHLLLPEDPALLAGSGPLVLVDDEFSTGRTVLNTVRDLHARAPRDRYVVVALTDMRSAADRTRLAEFADGLGARVDVIALATGTVVLPDGVLEAGQALVAAHETPHARPARAATAGADTVGAAAGGAARAEAVEPAAGTEAVRAQARTGAGAVRPGAGVGAVRRVELGWPEGLPDGGRHGFLPEHRRRLEAALPAMAVRVSAALPPDARRVLVLGNEELMYAPLRLAQALQDTLDPAAANAAADRPAADPAGPEGPAQPGGSAESGGSGGSAASGGRFVSGGQPGSGGWPAAGGPAQAGSPAQPAGSAQPGAGGSAGSGGWPAAADPAQPGGSAESGGSGGSAASGGRFGYAAGGWPAGASAGAAMRGRVPGTGPDGRSVWFSTTTRSPVLAVDDPGYAIRSRVVFAAHDGPTDDGSRERYAYNVAGAGFDAIVCVVDSAGDTPALYGPGGLLAALAPHTPALLLAVVPSYRPPAVSPGPRPTETTGARRAGPTKGTDASMSEPLRGPDFSSYAPDEVGWLLKDLSGVELEAPTEEREEAIQNGGAHYAESLPVEYQPSAAYQELFHAALRESAVRIARAVGAVTELVLAERGPDAVLVSLARAGTPVGVLMRRWARHAHGLELPHYAVSIVRGRGIDRNALRWLAAHHEPGDAVFVDGWTGKGAITRELADAVADFPGFDPAVAVLADPGGCVSTYGTRDDFLIPSACLNSTVSGLISRTVLRAGLIGPDDFHGAKFYRELRPADLSGVFLDTVSAAFEQAAPGVAEDVKSLHAQDRSPTWAGWAAVERISEEYGIGDVNLVKPGVGETTRVLLRRVPWKILARRGAAADLAHVRMLADQRGVPVEEVDDLPYSCVGLIHPRYTRGATGADGTAVTAL